MKKIVNTTTITIANGSSLSSSSVDMLGFELLAIHLDNNWLGTVLTFQGSEDGTHFNDLFDSSGGEIQITCQTGCYIGSVPAALENARYLKFRGGTSSVPVVQGGTTITLVRRPNS